MPQQYNDLESGQYALALANRELESLQRLLDGKDELIKTKDALIATQEEILVFLRKEHNGPS